MRENVKEMEFREIQGGFMSEFSSFLTTVLLDSGTKEEILDSRCCGNLKRLENGKEIITTFAWDDDESWDIITGDKSQFADMDEFLRTLSYYGLYLENVKDRNGYHIFDSYEARDGYSVVFHNVDVE